MKAMKEQGKAHMKAELAALRRGGASKALMKAEKAEYGMADGGMVQTAQPHVSSYSQNAGRRSVGRGGEQYGCYHQVTSKTDYGK